MTGVPRGASRIAALGHKARYDTVEDDTVVESIASQKDKTVHGLRRIFRKELDAHIAFVGLQRREIAVIGFDAHRGRGWIGLGHEVPFCTDREHGPVG